MALTLDEMKTLVARTLGDEDDADQLTAAGDAIQQAVREINSRQLWEFKRTVTNKVMVVGTRDYSIANAVRIYNARLQSNQRTLKFIRERDWDDSVRIQDTNNIPTHYTVVENAAGLMSVRVLPSPSTTETVEVDHYDNIVVPTVGATPVDVPDRFLAMVIALSKFYYLGDRDSETQRIQFWGARAEKLLTEAVAADGEQPDDDLGLTASDEVGEAYGPTDYWPSY